MTVTGNVYGASFQASVNERGNRAVLSSSFYRDGSALISWANVDAYVGVLGMHIRFFDGNNTIHDTIIASKGTDQKTTLPGVSVLKPITYNTLYLPDTVGIDTFTVSSNTLPSFIEVTLLNNIHPVANASNDGSRWAILRDWISNDAVKNHNGYGGTDISGDPKIYFEAGWGAPGIQDGKIYQVVTLPPGKYSFEGNIDWWYAGSQNDVYLVAANGTSGLPDANNLGSAFVSTKTTSGSGVTMPFTLTQPTTLSLGLLLEMANDGEAMRFNSLRLYITN